MDIIRGFIDRADQQISIFIDTIDDWVKGNNFRDRCEPIDIDGFFKGVIDGRSPIGAMPESSCFEMMDAFGEIRCVDGLQEFAIPTNAAKAFRTNQGTGFIGECLKSVAYISG